MNEEKKLILNGKETNAKDLKQFITEINGEYKHDKEHLKKELSQLHNTITSKEKEERLKLGKDRLHNEALVKEETKRKQLDKNLAEHLFVLKRKHLIQLQKLEYDLLSREINEQKTVLVRNHTTFDAHLNVSFALKSRHLNALQRRKLEFMEKEISEEVNNSKSYCERRTRLLKKKHATEKKQHPKHLKQQQANIRKLYKHQYNTQNKQYKTYKEQIMTQTPKDQVRLKLDQIKDEQNRKFSLLYEHYKTNVEAVYQQQNLKLTASQQLEQDQLNDDLEQQIKILYNSHFTRKKHQAETFAKENELLDAEKTTRKRELDAKIQFEMDEFEKNSSHKLADLKKNQADALEKFDAEYMDICLNLIIQNKNRNSVYNLETFSGTSSISHSNRKSYSSTVTNILKTNSKGIKDVASLSYLDPQEHSHQTESKALAATQSNKTN